MHSFYCPDVDGKFYQFNEEESKHCVRVLRLGVGDEVRMVDGAGGLYRARIVDAHAKACKVEITESLKDTAKRTYFLQVAMAPTKSADRFEWFLEKATEIGIDVITPLYTEHSERKSVKLERCEKVVISAVKQCLVSYRPRVDAMAEFKSFVDAPFEGNRYIAYCGPETKSDVGDIFEASDRSQVLIGPEGDFSEEEVHYAIQHGFIPITLGATRLRTETAGVFVCAAAALARS